jgi:hypothetical protein
MKSIWTIQYADYDDSGCDSHYSTREKAEAALAQLRRNVIAEKRRSCAEILAAVKSGRAPWWIPYTGTVDEAWAEREVAKVAADFDERYSVVEKPLDGFIPNLEEP